jgi:hypothetical protein
VKRVVQFCRRDDKLCFPDEKAGRAEIRRLLAGGGAARGAESLEVYRCVTHHAFHLGRP